MASLGEALAVRGHHLTVFSASKRGAVLPAATWYRVPMIRRPHAIRFVSFLVMNTLVRLAVRVLKRERFDVVHSTGPDVLRPSVATFHACSAAFARRLSSDRATPGWQRWSRLRRWSNILAYRMISGCERYVLERGARRVVTISGTLSREIHEAYRLGEDRLTVIPDGVDLAEFGGDGRGAGRRLRERLGISSDETVVLFVGHNWERKGLETLVSALALVRERERGVRPLSSSWEVGAARRTRRACAPGSGGPSASWRPSVRWGGSMERPTCACCRPCMSRSGSRRWRRWPPGSP